MKNTTPRICDSRTVRLFSLVFLTAALLPPEGLSQERVPQDGKRWRFASANDLHLGDLVITERIVTNPNTDLSLFKDRQKNAITLAIDEGCELLVSAGDWTGGFWNKPYHIDRWPDEHERIVQAGKHVYSNMIDGFSNYQLPFLFCVDDHELGDNSYWKFGTRVSGQIPYFKEAFANAFCKDEDGNPICSGTIGGVTERPVGTDFEHTSYATIKNNVLFVSLDLHEWRGPNTKMMFLYGKWLCVRTDLDPALGVWLDNVLEAGRHHSDVDHIVVFGHYPIMPGFTWWHSSNVTVYSREESGLNRLLKKHHVDVYVSGEVHAFSVNMDPESKVVYLSHGAHNELALWEATEDQLTIRLVSHEHPESEPDKCVEFLENGMLTIKKNGSGKTVSGSGAMVPLDHQGLLWNWDFDESEMPDEYINRGQGSETYMRLWTKDGLTGEPWQLSVEPGILGNAVRFYGNPQSHLGVYKAAPKFSRTGVVTFDRGLSMSAWIKTTMSGTGVIFSANSGYYVTDNSLFTMNLRDGKFAIGNVKFVSTTQAINDGKWHHVAVAQERGRCMADALLYVDGEVAEKEPSDAVGYNCVDVKYWEAHVGSRFDLDAGFDGVIDDPGFWMGALTPIMVKAMYNSAKNSELRFNAAQMDDLFHLFRNQKPGEVGGRSWVYGSYPDGVAGEIYKSSSGFYVVLDEFGNCMTTATAAPAFLPASAP